MTMIMMREEYHNSPLASLMLLSGNGNDNNVGFASVLLRNSSILIVDTAPFMVSRLKSMKSVTSWKLSFHFLFICNRYSTAGGGITSVRPVANANTITTSNAIRILFHPPRSG